MPGADTVCVGPTTCCLPGYRVPRRVGQEGRSHQGRPAKHCRRNTRSVADWAAPVQGAAREPSQREAGDEGQRYGYFVAYEILSGNKSTQQEAYRKAFRSGFCDDQKVNRRKSTMGGKGANIKNIWVAPWWTIYGEKP